MRPARNSPPTPIRRSIARGQPCPFAIVAGVGGLMERWLSDRDADARSGLRDDAMGVWARRFGWLRAETTPETAAHRGPSHGWARPPEQPDPHGRLSRRRRRGPAA